MTKSPLCEIFTKIMYRGFCVQELFPADCVQGIVYRDFVRGIVSRDCVRGNYVQGDYVGGS